MKTTILKHCLKNALDFGGTINTKVILGLTLKENPELGKPMRYGRKGTRELYIAPFRLSYLHIPEEEKIVIRGCDNGKVGDTLRSELAISYSEGWKQNIINRKSKGIIKGEVNY